MSVDFNINIYWCALGEKYFFLIEFTKATLYCSQVERNVVLILGFLFGFCKQTKLCEERLSVLLLLLFYNFFYYESDWLQRR